MKTGAGASRHDAILAGGVAAVFLLLPALAVLSHLGVAIALGLCGLLAATRARHWAIAPQVLHAEARRGAPRAIAAWSALLFCLWIAAGALRGDLEAADLALQIFVMTLSGIGLCLVALGADEKALRRLTIAYLLFAALAALALLFEGASCGAIRAAIPPEDLTPGRKDDMVDLARGVTAVAPSVLAAGVVLVATCGISRRRKAVIGAALGAAILYAAILHDVDANVAALLAGAAAAAAAFRFPAATLKTVAALFLVALLAAPLFALALDSSAPAFAELPVSWRQRLHVWEHLGGEILACQPLGCGADHARALWQEGETIMLEGAPIPLPLTPVHPHNVFLQIWLELGVPGALLFAVGAIAGALSLLRIPLSRAAAAAAAAVGVAALVSFLVEASLWQAWRLAAIGFGCAGAALAEARSRTAPA